MAKINNALECSYPEYEFLPSLASGEEDAVKIIQQDEKENILGYMYIRMNCWNRVVQTAAKRENLCCMPIFSMPEAEDSSYILLPFWIIKHRMSVCGIIENG
jgi:hypothetical protein